MAITAVGTASQWHVISKIAPPVYPRKPCKRVTADEGAAMRIMDVLAAQRVAVTIDERAYSKSYPDRDDRAEESVGLP